MEENLVKIRLEQEQTEEEETHKQTWNGSFKKMEQITTEGNERKVELAVNKQSLRGQLNIVKR